MQLLLLTHPQLLRLLDDTALRVKFVCFVFSRSVYKPKRFWRLSSYLWQWKLLIIIIDTYNSSELLTSATRVYGQTRFPQNNCRRGPRCNIELFLLSQAIINQLLFCRLCKRNWALFTLSTLRFPAAVTHWTSLFMFRGVQVDWFQSCLVSAAYLQI